MSKKALFILIFVSFAIVTVDASTNCPSNSDSFEEYKSISRAALLEFLGDPDNSKIISAEVGDLSAFYETYKNNWAAANCNEVGVQSGETIKYILEKYTGFVDSSVNCALTNAIWSVGQTVENTRVSLTVDAPRCDDKINVTFAVKEKDFTTLHDDAIENPNSAKIIGGIATTTWKAEWQEDIEDTPSGPRDDSPPEYYFTASLGSLSSKSELLLVSECPDIDGDGYKDLSCGGNDCDETNVDINPAAAEICGNLVDENCNLEYDDGAVCGYDFAKRTIFTEPENNILLEDGCVGDPELDLFSDHLFPEPLEPLGNTSDNWDKSYGLFDFNADGRIDFDDSILLAINSEGVDIDNDNYDTTICRLDCNDVLNQGEAINPGATEICDDDIDNNCNGAKDEGGVCGYDLAKRIDFNDHDSYVVGTDGCVGDSDLDIISFKVLQDLNPNLTGNGFYDLNGDGLIDAGDQVIMIGEMQGGDVDNDAYDTAICRKDCNDDDADINPGVTEICDDDIDNNCNGAKDEGGVCGYDLAKRTDFTRFNSYDVGIDSCIGDPDLDITIDKAGLNPNLTGNGFYDLNGDGLIDAGDQVIMIGEMEGGDSDGGDNDNDAYDTTTCYLDCNDVLNQGGNAIHPGATEICDNIDQNCNLIKNENGACGYDFAKRTIFTEPENNILLEDGCVGDPDSDVLLSKFGQSSLNNNNGKYDFNGDGLINEEDQNTMSGQMQGRDNDNDNYDTTTCHNDCNDGSDAIKPGATETCNNVDDDCDGLVDEELTKTIGCIQTGYCSGAVKTCTNGVWGACSKVPQTETCNNVDDDCDSYTDNEFEIFSSNTLTSNTNCIQTGYCSGARKTCTSGVWGACSKVPQTETCNNVDDDCDGTVDEDLTTTSDCSQIGYCSGAVKTCSAGVWGVCSKVPGTETCNGIDDNCDGGIDVDADGDVISCSDGLYCTTGDYCSEGSCQSTGTRNCEESPANLCTTDTCNEDTNSCVHTTVIITCSPTIRSCSAYCNAAGKRCTYPSSSTSCANSCTPSTGLCSSCTAPSCGAATCVSCGVGLECITGSCFPLGS
ncbi:putative metal-binding motif-containing protein [Candidatus Woesearchaeota archaeon]|nr:putative metal-binding motif-containing protein [Candidatus Woesearchaeota archaeon]